MGSMSNPSALFAAEATDAPEFVAAAAAVLDEADMALLTLVKIDGYFSQRWLGFSGKTLGVLRIAKLRLCVPPFVPGRVIWQRRFVRKSDWQQELAGPSLHVSQPSESNLKRWMDHCSPSTSVLWWSGNSAAVERGSRMLYRPTPAGWTGCYQEFTTPHWRQVFEKHFPAASLRSRPERYRARSWLLSGFATHANSQSLAVARKAVICASGHWR